MPENEPQAGHRMDEAQARDDAVSAVLGWMPGYTDGTEDRPQYKIVLVEETLNGGIFRWEPTMSTGEPWRYAEPDGATFRLYVFAERVPEDET